MLNFKRLLAEELEAANYAAEERTGFVNRTDSVLAFNPGTLSFTVTPAVTSFDIYVKNQLFTHDHVQQRNITDVDGLHYLYCDDAGELQHDTVAPSLRACWVAVVHWNATTNQAVIVGDERHGMNMPGDVHRWLHENTGLTCPFGLSLTGSVVGDGSIDSHAQVSLSDGELHDEDIKQIIADGSPQDISPIAKIPVFYRSGVGGAWTRATATSFPMKQGSARIAYNLNTAGTWTTPDAAQGNFVAMWICGTNDVTEPVIAILGQREDATLAAARDNNPWNAVALVFATAFNTELKVLYRLLVQTSTAYANTPHARLREIENFRATVILPGGTYSPASHSALADLWQADHPVTAIRLHEATEKVTPADADEVVIYDSVALANRRMTRANFLGGMTPGNNPRQTFTVSGSPKSVFDLTAFTYTPGAEQLLVFVGGVYQIPGTDYTETDSDTVTLVTAAAVGEVVTVIRNTGGLGGAGSGHGFFTCEGTTFNSLARPPFGADGEGTGGDHLFSFALPADFASFYKVTATILPNSTATGKDIDILFGWGTAGELYTANSVSDLSSLYNFVADTLQRLDITPLLMTGSAAAEDTCGIRFRHQAVGQTLYYLCLAVEYIKA